MPRRDDPDDDDRLHSDVFGREWYAPSRPRKTVGGIKAQSARGAFGASWWAKRWIAVLESFDIGSRLARGKAYARSGQVLSIRVDAGEVRAEVQGSQKKPYRVAIDLKPHSEQEWAKVAEALRKEARFVAELLSGRMPQDVEQAFLAAGAPLFPQRLRDLETRCSCPDASNPCKHIAAVYYLLGEEFDRDPFLLFLLRGMPREELTPLLAPPPAFHEDDAAAVDAQDDDPEEDDLDFETSDEDDGDGDAAEEDSWDEEPLPEAPAPPPADPAEFWKTTEFPADLFGAVQTPLASAALPRRLGGFPFWRGEARFLDALLPMYRAAAPAGLDFFMGNSGGVSGSGVSGGDVSGGDADDAPPS